jgi:drug/metabolite transporter (DMT)-like permease
MRSLLPSRTTPSGIPAAGLIWLALGVVYVLWGSTYLAIKLAERSFPPFLMASIRFLIAGGVLFVWSIGRGERGNDPIGRNQWRAAFVVGSLLLLGGNGGVVWAEQHVATGVVALLIATVPLWMAALDRVFYGHRLRTQAVAGLGLGFVGMVLLVSSSHRGHAGLAGSLVVVGAALCWAAGSVYSRSAPLPKRPLVATAMEMIGGGAGLAVLSVASGELGRFHPAQVTMQSVAALGYLVVFGSLVAFSAYVWLLRTAPMSLVGTYAYVNPVVALFLGWLILGEAISPRTAVASAIVIGGVALIVTARRVVEAPVGAEQPVTPVGTAGRRSGWGRARR